MGLRTQHRSPEELRTMDDISFEHGWVWLVYRIDSPNTEEEKWHIQGVADDRELAESFCLDENYLIGPVPRNTALPEGRIVWVGAYFPLKTEPVNTETNE